MSMVVDVLLSYFDRYNSLDEQEQEALRERISERKVKRRQFILQEGDVCRHYTFVVKGCFKMYRVDDSGKEHNLQFSAENRELFVLRKEKEEWKIARYMFNKTK
jgi:CRP-like cAMP-binding protein